MITYDYYTYADKDKYGQKTLNTTPTGTIKMNITIKSQAIMQDGVKYTSVQYVGLTSDAITDGYVIQYGDKKLKVLYVVPARFKMAIMEEM